MNRVKQLLTVKIVYYGPGLSGKTTNLLRLHDAYPQQERGEIVTLDTETERTLFFDYFPANLGKLGPYRLKADFFTVPGQSFYSATRRAVLEGADGVVFVADSAPEREEANLVTLDDMMTNLRAMGSGWEHTPLVFQWNKRDLPGAMSEKLLARQLNTLGAPAVPAVATEGVGVWETQALILEAVMARLHERAQRGRARV